MKSVVVEVFFDHRDNFIDGDLNVPDKSENRLLAVTVYFFEISATYEELIRKLIEQGRLLPLDDTRLRYNLILQAFEAYWQGIPSYRHSLSKPIALKEGQTLASTHLTNLVMDVSDFNHDISGSYISLLFCAISVEIHDDTQPEK